MVEKIGTADDDYQGTVMTTGHQATESDIANLLTADKKDYRSEILLNIVRKIASDPDKPRESLAANLTATMLFYQQTCARKKQAQTASSAPSAQAADSAINHVSVEPHPSGNGCVATFAMPVAAAWLLMFKYQAGELNTIGGLQVLGMELTTEPAAAAAATAAAIMPKSPRSRP